MLTRNYDSLTVGYLTILPVIYTIKESDWLGGMPGAVKTHYGLMKTVNQFPSSGHSIFGHTSSEDRHSQLQTGTSSSYPPILLVGSNNAEESYNDFALTILGDLTVVGARYANIAYTAEGCSYNTVKTFVNNTENDITVNEVGLYQHFSENFDVLLYRKKLAQPVVMKARGGTATFNLVIDIPYANKP